MNKLNFQIRSAREKDYPAVNRLYCAWQKYHHQLLPNIFKERLVKTFIKRSDYIGLLEDRKAVIFIATVEKQIIGFAEVQFDNVQAADDHYGSKQANIEYLYVLPEHQNKGVGKSLIATAIDWSIKKNRDYLSVSVYNDNEEALNLYQKNEFQPLSTRLVKKL